jgi:LmbE family N-acetylglucosaminyl deacetylase
MSSTISVDTATIETHGSPLMRRHPDRTVAQLDPRVDRVVVVVPHPDDEALATGLLLAHAAELGLQTVIIAVTDGDAAYPTVDGATLARVRRREQAAAVAALGHTPLAVRRPGVRDGAVAREIDRIAIGIDSELTPTTLLVAPSIHDWHPDHQACGEAAGRVAGTARQHWSSLFWAHHHPDELLATSPRIVELAAGDVAFQRRARAVECHRSQFESPRNEPAAVLRPDLVSHLRIPVEWYVEEPIRR